MGIQRFSSARVVLAFAVALLGVATLAGCAPSASPRPAPPTADEIAAMHEEQARFWWDSLNTGQPMPDVAVIEVLPGEEAFVRQTECLREADLPGVTVGSAGEWRFENTVDPVEDDPAYQLVQQRWWVCSQQFPSADDDDWLMSSRELEWLHGFYAKRYLPCLASLGFEPVEFPSRDSFVEEANGYASWIPHDFSVTPTPTPQQWDKIAVRCPLPYLLAEYELPGSRSSG